MRDYSKATRTLFLTLFACVLLVSVASAEMTTIFDEDFNSVQAETSWNGYNGWQLESPYAPNPMVTDSPSVATSMAGMFMSVDNYSTNRGEMYHGLDTTQTEGSYVVAEFDVYNSVYSKDFRVLVSNYHHFDYRRPVGIVARNGGIYARWYDSSSALQYHLLADGADYPAAAFYRARIEVNTSELEAYGLAPGKGRTTWDVGGLEQSWEYDLHSYFQHADRFSVDKSPGTNALFGVDNILVTVPEPLSMTVLLVGSAMVFRKRR